MAFKINLTPVHRSNERQALAVSCPPSQHYVNDSYLKMHESAPPPEPLHS